MRTEPVLCQLKSSIKESKTEEVVRCFTQCYLINPSMWSKCPLVFKVLYKRDSLQTTETKVDVCKVTFRLATVVIDPLKAS